MKSFLALTLWSTTSIGQCDLTLTSVSYSNEINPHPVFAVLEIIPGQEVDLIAMPGGPPFSASGPFTYDLLNPINNPINAAVVCNGIVSVQPLSYDMDYFFESDDVTVTNPFPSCNGSNGMICSNGGASFTANGIASVNSCVADLGIGTYSIVFDPITDNEVTYTSPPFEVHIGIDAEYEVNAAGDLDINVTGGSGNITVEMNSLGSPSNDAGTWASGCQSTVITDLNGPCTVTFTSYVSTTCLGDFNLDGFVTVGDLSGFLGVMGTTTNGDGDFNCDGFITVSELTPFLGAFGNVCN